jgi:hypothetical protein
MADRGSRRPVVGMRIAAGAGSAPWWMLLVYGLVSGMLAAAVGGLVALPVGGDARASVWSVVAVGLGMASGWVWRDVSAVLAKLSLSRRGGRPRSGA